MPSGATIMLRRFASSLLTILLLCSCTAESVSSSEEAQYADLTQAQKDCRRLITGLHMENMEAVKSRIVKGQFFMGEDIVDDAGVYYSKETGNTDTVAVFYAGDTEAVLPYISDYLEEKVRDTKGQYPDQVFKISNAVLDHDDRVIVLVICSDIEDAKKEVAAFLNK